MAVDLLDHDDILLVAAKATKRIRKCTVIGIRSMIDKSSVKNWQNAPRDSDNRGRQETDHDHPRRDC